MSNFDKDDIRKIADCRDIMRDVFHAREHGGEGRFDCPWRPGSDSGAVAVEREEWYDHVAKEGGDAIKLIERGMGKTFQDALDWLGEYYHLAPTAPAKVEAVPLSIRVVTEYVYTDAEGNPVHKKIRYKQPKDFRQQSFVNGKWTWGMSGVAPVLYHLPEVIAGVKAGKWIFQVEGEKDADNLARMGFCATTQTNGAGSWCQAYTDVLKGANVCIIADKDAPGRKHATLVAEALAGQAKVIKVMELPGEGVKDASDWINAGGDGKSLKNIVLAAEEWHKKPATTAPTEVAKKRNSRPFANYTTKKVIGEDGKKKTEREPRLLQDLRTELFTRFQNFPCRVGWELFDHDRQKGEIRPLPDKTSLFAWIQQKSNQSVNWASLIGAVSREEFYSDLLNNARKYELISSVPTWPPRDDVYYTYGKLPEPTPDRRHLETFLAFFNLADDASRAMLRAFVASPLYYEPKVDRPLWVIDSDTAQGSGKTKLVEFIARLYGADPDDGEPFGVDVKSIINEQSAERVWRRLLSTTGRRKRLVLIDNVTGFLAAPSLAALTTQGSITGMAPYGRGEETRRNDLTYVITSNSARLDRDLVSRTIFIKVQKPSNPDPQWPKKVVAYIDAHRMNIIAEIIDILKHGAPEVTEVKTRFRTWEVNVMAPMIGDEKLRMQAIRANEELQADSDYDLENAEAVLKYFSDKIAARYGENAKVFLPSGIIAKWYMEALPDEQTKRKSIPQIIKNWAKAGMLPEINFNISRYKGDGQRGVGWNLTICERGDWEGVSIYSEEGR